MNTYPEVQELDALVPDLTAGTNSGRITWTYMWGQGVTAQAPAGQVTICRPGWPGAPPWQLRITRPGGGELHGEGSAMTVRQFSRLATTVPLLVQAIRRRNPTLAQHLPAV